MYVVVGAQVVKMAGWQFAATIEHDEDGNIIRQVPGVEVDLSAYRTVAAWCSHCNTARNRIDTFVVLHEDGCRSPRPREGRILLTTDQTAFDNLPGRGPPYGRARLITKSARG